MAHINFRLTYAISCPDKFFTPIGFRSCQSCSHWNFVAIMEMNRDTSYFLTTSSQSPPSSISNTPKRCRVFALVSPYCRTPNKGGSSCNLVDISYTSIAIQCYISISGLWQPSLIYQSPPLGRVFALVPPFCLILTTWV